MYLKVLLYILVTLCEVFEISSDFVTKPSNETISYNGSSVTLGWGLAIGDIVDFKKWSHNDATIISIQRINETYDFVSNTLPAFNGRVTYTPTKTDLTIRDLQLSDEGKFSCSVTLNSGVAIVSETFLRVILKPAFINPATSQITALEFENKTLSCIIDSRPGVNITWYKDGTEIVSDGRIVTDTQTANNGVVRTTSNLVLTGVTRDDRGDYRCVARYEFGEEETTTSFAVYYQPENSNFQKILSSIQQLRGNLLVAENITLLCSCDASPRPFFAIYQDSTLLRNTTDGALKITNLAKSYEGKYKCEPRNYLNAGAIKTQTVIVYAKTKLLSRFDSTIVNVEGDTLYLFYEIHGDPKPNIIWSQPNASQKLEIAEIIKSNDSGLVLLETTAKIASLSRSDSGLYECFANNTFGFVSILSELTVNYPATITSSQPATYGTVEFARNVELECAVYGNPLSTVRWFVNNVLIAASDANYTITDATKENQVTKESYASSVLALTSVKKSDFGEYTCEATNNVPGRGERSANKTTTLVVSHKPYFLQNPDDFITAELGSNIVFNCTVQSHMKLTVFWSTEVGRDTRFTFDPITLLVNLNGKVIAEALLKIKDIHKMDYGMYMCTADDTNSTIVTNTTLLIEYPPEFIKSPPSVQILAESSIEYLECVVDSFPRANVEWFYAVDGKTFTNVTHLSRQEMLPSETYEIKVQSRLHFSTRIYRENEGVYYCTAKNKMGNITKHTNITVEWPAEFDTGTINGGTIGVKLMEPATFNCIVRSNPPPVIKWVKNDLNEVKGTATVLINTLFENSTTTVKESILTINNTTADDTGLYTCAVENTVAGTKIVHRRERYLNVWHPPIVEVQSTTQTIALESSISLSCKSKSNPAVNRYLWKKDGVILNVNQSEYNIGYVDHDAKGVYTCIPENAEGNGSTVTHVIYVKVVPVFTKAATCKEEAGVYYCHCEGKGFPTPQVAWRLHSNDTTITSTNTLNLTIGMSSVGVYHCTLMNIHGSAVSNITLLPVYGVWTQWGSCNETCGDGYKTRTRICNYKTCQGVIEMIESCNIDACPVVGAQTDRWHKDWYIAFWILIPVFIVLLVICVLWVARRNRGSSKPIFVPMNRDLSQPPSVRSIPTQREIYLPQPTEMSAVNNGYVDDAPPKKRETDTIEVEMYFGEEEVEVSRPVSHPTIDNDVESIDETADDNNDDQSEDENDESFKDADFHYLNGPNGVFQLYDRVVPPKANGVVQTDVGHDNKSFTPEQRNGYV